MRIIRFDEKSKEKEKLRQFMRFLRSRSYFRNMVLPTIKEDGWVGGEPAARDAYIAWLTWNECRKPKTNECFSSCILSWDEKADRTQAEHDAYECGWQTRERLIGVK